MGLDPIGSGAAAGFRDQRARYDLDLVSERGHARGAFDPAATVRALTASKPDAVYFFGAGADLRACRSPFTFKCTVRMTDMN